MQVVSREKIESKCGVGSLDSVQCIGTESVPRYYLFAAVFYPILRSTCGVLASVPRYIIIRGTSYTQCACVGTYGNIPPMYVCNPHVCLVCMYVCTHVLARYVHTSM